MKQECEAREANDRIHRHRGAGDTVDASIEQKMIAKSGAPELIGERRMADFPTAAFAVDQYVDVRKFAAIDHESGGYGLLFTDLLQDPGRTLAASPVAYSEQTQIVAHDVADFRPDGFRYPQAVRVRNSIFERLRQEPGGLEIDIGSRRRAYAGRSGKQCRGQCIR